MALEIGQVAGTVALFPTSRGANQGDAAAQTQGTALPGQQAPPLTGVGGKPLSGEALQTLQGSGGGEKPKTANPDEQLSDDEKKTVDALKKRDAEVRRHEAAHAAAGGQYAGAPTFTYQQGPDGKRYAIGGEVSIDTSPVSGDPEATARKADQIRAAALAPADPSGQDRAVAAAASKLKLDAQAEAAAKKKQEADAKAAEKKADEPAIPGQKKPEESAAEPKPPEIVGPKPVGAKDDAKKTGEAEGAGGIGPARPAAAAQAYSRTENTVSKIGKATESALSLVA